MLSDGGPRPRAATPLQRDVSIRASVKAIPGVEDMLSRSERLKRQHIATPVRVPVVVLGAGDAAAVPAIQCRAAIDTMAMCSCVSLGTVAELGLEQDIERPANGQEFLRAFDDSLVSRRGTVRLRMACGESIEVHQFEVIGGEERFLLGADLYPKFGIYLGGLPVEAPGQRRGETEGQRADVLERRLRLAPKPWSVECEASAEERAQLMERVEPLLAENERIAVQDVACEGIEAATMRIPLKVERSWRHQYPLPDAARPAVKETISGWIENGFVEPGSSAAPWNTAITAAGKKDLEGRRTKWRTCMDMRHLNAQWAGPDQQAKDRMPHLGEVFLRMRGFRFCSTLDLAGAYHQLAIAEADRDKTSFTFEGQRWRWRRWFFGMKPATTQFQEVMETVMDGVSGVAIWVDDLCVYSKGTMAEHAELVAEVLRRLTQHKLRVNRDKCHFGYTKALVLGHFVGGMTRQMDPLKAQQAFEWPQPTCGKDVERLQGSRITCGRIYRCMRG